MVISDIIRKVHRQESSGGSLDTGWSLRRLVPLDIFLCGDLVRDESLKLISSTYSITRCCYTLTGITGAEA